jgi:hypothetical protein
MELTINKIDIYIYIQVFEFTTQNYEVMKNAGKEKKTNDLDKLKSTKSSFISASNRTSESATENQIFFLWSLDLLLF